MHATALAVMAVLAIPATLQAQDHPLVGSWDLTFAAGVQVENGVPTPIRVTGTFAVTVEGDSLVAVLERPAIAGMPARPPSRFATRVSDTWPIVFEQRSDATIHMGNGEEKRTAISTWTLTVAGDTIEGTLERRIEGMDVPGGGPQPVRGVRKQG